MDRDLILLGETCNAAWQASCLDRDEGQADSTAARLGPPPADIASLETEQVTPTDDMELLTDIDRVRLIAALGMGEAQTGRPRRSCR